MTARSPVRLRAQRAPPALRRAARQPGRAGEVASWQWRCSKQLPAQRRAHKSPGTQRAPLYARLARSSTNCCTWQQEKGPAAGRCGRRTDQDLSQQTQKGPSEKHEKFWAILCLQLLRDSLNMKDLSLHILTELSCSSCTSVDAST